ncbi:ROK family protein [Jeotgalibaca caeni]|uniref:ROK family protein n=1 Tax=Jeotgalibaca caeni TaxID=3028623 RepID=UPI00237DB4BB|nr:ROK family protein [Jeotgalibaca caeni]MDE1549124.1 ROK family protein [Jeotgalibaca caeni]
MKELFGSIEAGGTKFVLAIGDSDYNIVERLSIPTHTPEETMPNVIDFFKQYQLKGIGLGCFGPIDLKKTSPTYGYITNTPKIAWQMYNIVGELEEALNVPVFFTTDVNAACYGEYTTGSARDLDSCVYFTVGTGIGAGAINQGSFVEGFSHPEVGHMIVNKHPLDDYIGNCPYHSNCLEGFASGPSIEERLGKKGEKIDEQDPIWDIISSYLAQAAYNTTLYFSPQKIIFGGGVMKQPHLLGKVKSQFEELLNGYVLTPAVENYIVLPELEDNTGTIGCLALAKGQHT